MPGSLSFSTSRRDLVRARVEAFAADVLDGAWRGRKIHVWGAGRDGRCFVNELDAAGRGGRVEALYDVDAAKLGTYHNGATGLTLPVFDVRAVATPFVVCVSLRDPAVAAFVKATAARLGAVEGVDYWHFN